MWLGIAHEHDPPGRRSDDDVNCYRAHTRIDPAATLST
jgi:hypothetical protein